MRHVTMELGGKSPLIVFGDADLEAAVSGAILGNFYSSGQVCSNGTRVFVERGCGGLPRPAARAAAGVVMGDPLDEATNFGPMASARQMEIVLGYVERGVAEGAELVAGGRRANRPGWFVEPTVFAGVTDAMTIAREEIFGPVMCVLDFEDEDEVVARANATDLGLAAGVFTRDMARAHRVAGAMEAGTVWINAYNLTPAGFPSAGRSCRGSGGRTRPSRWSITPSCDPSMSGREASMRRSEVPVPPRGLRAAALAPGSGGGARLRRAPGSTGGLRAAAPRAVGRGLGHRAGLAAVLRNRDQSAMRRLKSRMLFRSPLPGWVGTRAASRTLARRLRRWPAAILDPARSLGRGVMEADVVVVGAGSAGRPWPSGWWRRGFR
jgi:hypothetical protein